MVSLPWTIFAQESDYVKLTRDEAKAYLKSASLDGLIDDVIKLDYIEHAVPGVVLPQAVIAVQDRDVILTWIDEGLVEVSVKPYLLYKFKLDMHDFRNIIPKPKDKTLSAILAIISTSLVSVLTDSLGNALLPKTWNPFYSAAVGSGVGLSIYLFTSF